MLWSHPTTKWVVCAVISIAAVYILFKIVPLREGALQVLILDLALLLSSSLAVILLVCRRPPSAPPSGASGFAVGAHASKIKGVESFEEHSIDEEDGSWVDGLATNGQLVTYVTSYSKLSYLGNDSSQPNMWQDVSRSLTGHVKTNTATRCPSLPTNFLFNTAKPRWKRDTGFALAQTTVTGPNSMDVFPSTSHYTVFCTFQLTGLPTDGTTASLIFIPANGSPIQNGLTIALSAVDRPDMVESSTGIVHAATTALRTHVSVSVGNQAPLVCDDNYSTAGHRAGVVTFDANARYLLTVTKYGSNIRVSLFHIESSTSKCTPNIIMAASIDDDALKYNNQPITLNGNGSLMGSLMCFGIFNEALEPGDESQICAHYHNLFLKMDPSVQAAHAAVKKATKALECPYDILTCGSCAAVTSWTSAFGVAEGGPSCTTAINKYCMANPKAIGCQCWDTSVLDKSVMVNQTCQAVRSLYSGNKDAMCAGPVKVALANAAVTASAVADKTRAALLQQIKETEEELQAERSQRRSLDTTQHRTPVAAIATHPPGSSSALAALSAPLSLNVAAKRPVPDPLKKTFLGWFFGF